MSKEMREIREMIDKIKNFKQFVNESEEIVNREPIKNGREELYIIKVIPKYVYHATFKPLLKKIKSEGLGGGSANQLWSDSKKGVVYLAKDGNVAYSYAETVFDENDDIPESWEEQIIILVIDTEKLDRNKFYLDRNVLDNEGDTFEYHGIIPFDTVVNIVTEDDLQK